MKKKKAKQAAAKRKLGPAAKALKRKRQTARPRPPAPPGEDARIALRREQSLTARAQGANYRQIAKELGVSVGTAHEDVIAELSAVCIRTKEKAIELRALLMERADFGLRCLVKGCLSVDPTVVSSSVRSWARIVELQGKLNGLISLAKVQDEELITPGSTLTEREIAFRVEKLVQFAEEERAADRKKKARTVH